MEAKGREGTTGISASMRAAVGVADRCHDLCLGTAINYCLQRGGEHSAQGHMRLMLDCAEICRTAANFMLVDSPYHRDVCAVCAEVCEHCGEDCARLQGMDACAQACRDCAESCRRMAGGPG